MKTNGPAECLSQTTESTDHLAHALHALCFAPMTLFLPTMNASPGRVGNY